VGSKNPAVRANEPSFTAAWVAALRGLGDLLPREVRLSEDPFGLRFSAPYVERVAGAARRFPGVAARALSRDHVLQIQIRTRVLDDELLGFVARGGRQVILLGAGFDCRPARFRRELEGVTVFEVDHPATQDKKRRVLAEIGADTGLVRYLPWDFEARPMADLPGCLSAVGHDPSRPTLTLWEGVTMYLTPDAIDAAVAAVRALSAPGSSFVFTYFDRAVLTRPPLRLHVFRALAARMGEPFRFGWDPLVLPAWLACRGFTLVSDRTDADLARELFPPRFSATCHGGLRHIAVAERAMPS
jgi:methyltransferase (TIGR00027 family)